MTNRGGAIALFALVVSCSPGTGTAPTATTSSEPSDPSEPATTPAASPSGTPSRTLAPSPSPSAAPSPPPAPSPTVIAAPGPEEVSTAAAFAEAAALAEVIGGADAVLMDPTSDDDTKQEWARAQQAALRRLVGDSAQRDTVTEALPEPSRTWAVRNVDAGSRLRELTAPRDALPPWRIVAAPSPEELRGYYDDAAATFGVDWSYLAAIHLVETRFGRIRGTSIAGAQGPMQFIPETWEAYGEGDIEDPHDAILAAGRYLAANGAPGDMGAALFAYNHSDHYVSAIESYALNMREEPATYLGYHAWQVYYRMAACGDGGSVTAPDGAELPCLGDAVLLSEGYESGG